MANILVFLKETFKRSMIVCFTWKTKLNPNASVAEKPKDHVTLFARVARNVAARLKVSPLPALRLAPNQKFWRGLSLLPRAQHQLLFR